MRIRKFIALALLPAAIAVAPSLAAADKIADFYKDKTVKIVIGASMGGAYGLYAQLLSRHVSKYLPGAPTVVVQPQGPFQRKGLPVYRPLHQCQYRGDRA